MRSTFLVFASLVVIALLALPAAAGGAAPTPDDEGLTPAAESTPTPSLSESCSPSSPGSESEAPLFTEEPTPLASGGCRPDPCPYFDPIDIEICCNHCVLIYGLCHCPC